MSIESKVFEKLFTADKVELESQKVELALLDDAANLSKLLKSLNTQIKADGDKANDLYSKVSVNGEKALSAFSQASKLIDRIDQMFRDLGQPANDPDYTELISQLDTVLTYRKRYNF